MSSAGRPGANPSVECGTCGLALEEPTDLDPTKRTPCPRCGSLNRKINVSLSEQLRIIEGNYNTALQGSNTRIADIKTRAQEVQLAGEASGKSSASASLSVAREEVALTAELFREQSEAIRNAVHALIETEMVGQRQALDATSELTKLTDKLVQWTRVIGVATILALVIGVIALLVAITGI
jgi:hypothetical protein